MEKMTNKHLFILLFVLTVGIVTIAMIGYNSSDAFTVASNGM